MFVAGIKIFFGFVAGAILLVLGIAVLRFGWFAIVAVFEAVARKIRQVVKFVQTHPGTVVLAVVYLLAALVLADDNSPTLVQ